MLINEQIRTREVRLIGSDGEQIGIKAINEARALANDEGLDLVMMSPNARPPVCKIMDYGKFRFEQAKKAKEAKKNQKVITLKEMRLSATIDVHDMQVKAKNVNKFLAAGDKVKVSIRFKGRQMAHTENGRHVMDKFEEMISEYGVVEKKAKMEGRNMYMILAPKS
ncbi:MAG: translation initiation factor IF-3 [Eubacteriales bacterium]